MKSYLAIHLPSSFVNMYRIRSVIRENHLMFVAVIHQVPVLRKVISVSKHHAFPEDHAYWEAGRPRNQPMKYH